MKMDGVNQLRVKTEQVPSEVDPTDAVDVASYNVNSEKPNKNSCDKRLPIIRVVQMDNASHLQQNKTISSIGESQYKDQAGAFNVDVKVEPVDTEEQMDFEKENLLSVKTEQMLSEVEPTNVVASKDLNLVKRLDSSHTERLQIVPTGPMNIQQGPALDGMGETQCGDPAEALILDVNVKAEPADTDDALCCQAGAVAERVALGLWTTCDLPLDVVKEDEEDEDGGSSAPCDLCVRLRMPPLKQQEDMTIENIHRSYETKETTEQPKRETNSAVEDKPDQMVNNVNGKQKLFKTLIECNVCKKSICCKPNLDIHMLIHTGEKPYDCNVCKKSFTRKSNLDTHMRIHTGEKPYDCNLCMRKYSYKHDLDIHMRTHTGEKPFDCNLCKKRFHRKQNLISHMLIHTGEKPFDCNVCKKRFNQKHHLYIHMLIHTGEKPFDCNVCDE